MISRLKGAGDSALGICIIWSMVSDVMRKRISLDEDIMSLCLGIEWAWHLRANSGKWWIWGNRYRGKFDSQRPISSL
jgi:hypothetical protein